MSQNPVKQKIIFGVVIILIISSAAIFVSQQFLTRKPIVPASPVFPTPSPSSSPLPLTSQNIDQELSQTDTKVQSILDEFDRDLVEFDQIDASDETVEGL